MTPLKSFDILAKIKPFNNLSVGAKIIAAYTIALVLMLGIGGVALFWLNSIYAAADENTRGLVYQTEVIVLVTMIAAGALGLWLAFALRRNIGGAITDLTAVVTQITGGDMLAPSQVESNDEIGQLGAAFNTITDRLEESISSLKKQTQQLETVVQISQHLAGILDLNDLLNQVVTLTKTTFGYYHAHIYLLNTQSLALVMTAGYGEVGAEMKRQGHSIPLGAAQSLVARAAREAHIITVENTCADPTWLPHPLLPETRSEMAIPVISGQEVMGVLDVQSDRLGGVTSKDELLLQALANQVAIAVRNARAFSQTQEALVQAQKLQRLYTGEAWEKFSALRSTTDYEVRQPSLPPLQEINTPEAALALQHKRRIISDGNQPAVTGVMTGEGEQQVAPSEPTLAEPAILFSNQAAEQTLAIPLKVGEEIIGVLGIRDERPGRCWTDEELALIDAVSEQMSLAIENARLFEETGRRAGREKIIADVTREIWASGELEQVMRTTVEQLGLTLNASRVVLRLGAEEQFVTVSTPVNDDFAQKYDPDSINFNNQEKINNNETNHQSS